MLHDLISDSVGAVVVLTFLAMAVVRWTAIGKVLQVRLGRTLLRQEQAVEGALRSKQLEAQIREEHRLRELPLELEREAQIKELLHRQQIATEQARLEAIERNRRLMLAAFKHKSQANDFTPLSLPGASSRSALQAQAEAAYQNLTQQQGLAPSLLPQTQQAQAFISDEMLRRLGMLR